MNDTFMKEKPIFPLLVSMALPNGHLDAGQRAVQHCGQPVCGPDQRGSAMTALSLVYPVQNLINAIAIGFGVGINAQIALLPGRG